MDTADHDLLIMIGEDVKHLREIVEEQRTSYDDSFEKGGSKFDAHDVRLRCLEQDYGKLMTVVVIVGGGITAGVNIAFWVWGKIGGK